MRKFLLWYIFSLFITGVAWGFPWFFGADQATLIPSNIGHATSSSLIKLTENEVSITAASGVSLNGINYPDLSGIGSSGMALVSDGVDTLSTAFVTAVPTFNASSVSSDTTLDASHDVVLVSASPSPVIITLVSATTIGLKSKVVTITVANNFATHPITIVAPEAQTINGTSSEIMVTPGASMEVVAIGGNWETVQYPNPTYRTFVAEKYLPAGGTGQVLTGINQVDTLELLNVRLGVDDSFAVLASDQVTITKSGTYEICLDSMAPFVISISLAIFNVTDSVRVLGGNNQNPNGGSTIPSVCHVFKIENTTVFEGQIIYTNGGSNNQNSCSSSTGRTQCLVTTLKVRKLK